RSLAKWKGGARGHSLERPEGRLPHGDPRPHEGSTDKERGDRSGGGKGRVHTEARVLGRRRASPQGGKGGSEAPVRGFHWIPAGPDGQHRGWQGGPSRGRRGS